LAAEQDTPGASSYLDDLLLDGGREGAEQAWPIILLLIERAPDDETMAFVAAGPLEDLAYRHGRQFADRLVAQTRRDPRFRQAIRGIWGWQGIPEPWRGELLRLIGVTPVRARRRRRDPGRI
jgi:hypothetical protein